LVWESDSAAWQDWLADGKGGPAANGSARRGAAQADAPTGRSGPVLVAGDKVQHAARSLGMAGQ